MSGKSKGLKKNQQKQKSNNNKEKGKWKENNNKTLKQNEWNMKASHEFAKRWNIHRRKYKTFSTLSCHTNVN